ncbi:uncharacterized protein LOC106169590 [Lingula anatina]|uniref:Uncharacterized protein LOC106169590 n=1 Tax=Lingula anatina TaxID=7574 RepID=A0A1S3J3U5_LINAN|nr:uncharacterized protein LOC106169590 [Lingula anatina]|eukprot:XP_013404539.1 uncharacterized protein LOC106169590 [Lingula anatina]
MDCRDHSGRTVCWSKMCYKNIPCNKDNDCYFYAAADVAEGHPHPLCFDDTDSVRKLPSGYGTCMMAEIVGNKYELLKGARPNAALSKQHKPDVGPLAFQGE